MDEYITIFDQSDRAHLISKDVADNHHLRHGQTVGQERIRLAMIDNCLVAIDVCKTALAKKDNL